MGERVPIASDVETRLLTESRRRCCLCVFLEGDVRTKQVQIAHISRDASDSTYENLAILCLPHHDRYDSKTSQSKGFTPQELRYYKDRLVDLIDRWGAVPPSIVADHAFAVEGQKVESEAEQAPAPSTVDLISGVDLSMLMSIALAPNQTDDAIRVLHEGNLLSPEVTRIGIARFNRSNPRFEGEPYCVVLLADPLGWHWDVSLLLYRGAKWRLVGRIPLKLQRGGEPPIQYVSGNDASALVIQHVEMYGTGVYRKGTTWYRVGPEGLLPLFTYPVQAYVVGWATAFQRHLSSEVITMPYTINDGAKLDIALHVRYEADPSWLCRYTSPYDTLPLFTTTLNLNLRWAGDARLFVPTEESTASLNEGGEIFDEDEHGFLRRNVDRLVELAKTGSDFQRKWVRDFAELLSNAPETQRISAALER